MMRRKEAVLWSLQTASVPAQTQVEGQPPMIVNVPSRQKRDAYAARARMEKRFLVSRN